MKAGQGGWAVALTCDMSLYAIHSHRLGQYNQPIRWSLAQARRGGCSDGLEDLKDLISAK